MPIQRITTTTEAHSMNGITEDWKIVARKLTPYEWTFHGSLNAAPDYGLFQQLAFQQSHISCVTGRDDAGRQVLYARIYPYKLRRV